MVALKGKNGHEELLNAKKAIDTLGVELVGEEKFMIEEDATRINLYFKKVKHTPSKYPRAYGQIKKNLWRVKYGKSNGDFESKRWSWKNDNFYKFGEWTCTCR